MIHLFLSIRFLFIMISILLMTKANLQVVGINAVEGWMINATVEEDATHIKVGY